VNFTGTLNKAGISDGMIGYGSEAAYKIHPVCITYNRRITGLLKKLFDVFFHLRLPVFLMHVQCLETNFHLCLFFVCAGNFMFKENYP
jgi:hypothetical protein